MTKSKVQVIHSIPLNTGKVETIEIGEGETHQGCEWQYIDDKGALIHQSKNQYGNPIAALRDGLITIIGLPDNSRLRDIELEREVLIQSCK